MIRWDGLEWRKAEDGFFFFDIGGTLIVMASMVAILAYIGVQLSYMSDLEGNITADYIAREQLDLLCIEKDPVDLGDKVVEANNHTYQVKSTSTAGLLSNMVHYGVKVTWQDRKGQQEIEIGKDVPVHRESSKDDLEEDLSA